MEKLFKRCLAAVLAFAMAFTLLPVSEAKATETNAGTETYTQAVSKMFASGGQTGMPEANTNLVAITGGKNEAGDKSRAAYESGVTASAEVCDLGSSRVVGMGFELPAASALNSEDITAAKLTITVHSTNQEMQRTDKRWTKAGLFSVDASKYADMSADET